MTAGVQAVPKGESRLAGLICVGCCLVLACSGCTHLGPRQRGILRGDRSLHLDQVSEAEGPAMGEKDRCEPAGVSTIESKPRPDGEPEYLDWTVPEEPGLEETDSGGSSSEASCEAPPILEPDRPYPIRSALAGLSRPVGARLAARRYLHPRFHPVPLQPVFLPRVGAAPPADLGAVPGDGQLPATPPGEAAPQIDILLPSPPPEGLPSPQAESEYQDRVTRLRRRLETASRPGGWIYSLTPDRRSAGRPVSVDRGSVMDYGK